MTSYVEAPGGGLSSPTKVIYDDDSSWDWDIAFVLASLHRWIDTEDTDILAFINSNGQKQSSSVFKIFNDYFEHDITIGEYKGTPVYSVQPWQTNLISVLPPGDDEFTYPDSDDVYYNALVSAEDSSVAIVQTGFSTALVSFMQTPGGPALLKAKVSALYVMGGDYPSREGEFNFAQAPAEANYLVTNWTTQNGYPPIYFTGSAFGSSITIGVPDTIDPEVHPAACVGNYKTLTRPGWDMMSLFQGIFGLDHFTLTAEGTNTVDSVTGDSVFDEETQSGHYYVLSGESVAYYEYRTNWANVCE